MAQKSLKNLDSFSRGYIEDVRSNVDFGSTMRAIMNSDPIVTANSFILASNPVNPSTNQRYVDEIETPLIGKIISGIGIQGTPRVTEISGDDDDSITISFDQPQTLAANTVVTFSEGNSGIDQYELTGSSKRRSKEDIRIDSIVPEDLLNYSVGQSE